MNLKQIMDDGMKQIEVDNDLKQDILDQTVRKRRGVEFLKGYRKSVAAAALCAVVLIGSVSVAAMELPRLWDHTVAKMTGASKGIQEKSIQEGTVDIVSGHDQKEGQEITEVTNNGVTIRAKQTMMDAYGMYIYLEVETSEDIKLDPDLMCFQESEFKLDGTNAYSSSSSGFVEDSYAVSDNKRGYEIYLQDTKEADPSGKLLSLHFKDLVSDNMKDPESKEEIVAGGSWNLQWRVSAADKVQKKNIKIGKTVKTDGGTLTLKQMELSPMSFRILYDSDNEECFKKGEFSIPYTVSLKMKDGSIYGYEENGYSLFDGPATVNPDYELQGFHGILDIDQVAAVVIDGVEYPVQ